MTELSLADVPRSIREVVAAAEAMGNVVVTIAQWTKMLVVHMHEPLTAAQRDALKAGFSSLQYARNNGDPHNPANETFFDATARVGVSFPIGYRFVR